MRSVTRIHLASVSPAVSSITAAARQTPMQCPFRQQQQQQQCLSGHRRPFHSSAAPASPLPTAARAAEVVPVYSHGPPPNAPQPLPDARHKKLDPAREAEERAIRIARRKALAAKTSATDSGRFWKTSGVALAEAENGENSKKEKTEKQQHLEVRLDTRALRHPTTRQVIRLPPSKKMLAHALAAEWDQLASVRQATQGHRVPLTSLVCRALDLDEEARAYNDAPEKGPQRAAVVENLMRYLDTDSLLCWVPPDGEGVLSGNPVGASLAGAPVTSRIVGGRETTLRQLQERTAGPILEHMAKHVWPGVRLEPVLGGAGQGNIMFPKPHPPETRAAVAQWLKGLNAWDLAGVERATLAGKSLVVAARLVSEWSRTAAPSKLNDPDSETVDVEVFSVEDAFAAANMETAFQTAQWGEVEDTHDVEEVDLRRHFGSVVLLVS